ncbi:hypothetical protein VYU27_008462, partial [Nannochloropsis oceanica]
GEADLQLYDCKLRKRHQSALLPEGSVYVMHNEAVTRLDHAVSAPHASFKDNRVTVVLRFIDRSSYSRLCKDVRRRQRRLQRKREGGREGGRN